MSGHQEYQCKKCGYQWETLDALNCQRCKELAEGNSSVEVPECAVEGCKTKAVCLLAVKGNWFPICKEHSTNRLFPRRNFFESSETPI